MPNGIVTRTGNSPEPFDMGQMWNSFMNSSRTGVGTKDAKNIGNGQPPAAPPLFSGGDNFFTRLMNSSKTGVGTKDARDIGSKKPSAYYGPGGNRDGSGQGQAQQTPGMGPFQGHGTVDVPRPSQPTGMPAMGGSRSVMNANGVPQTVMDTGNGASAAFVPEYGTENFNDLLGRVLGKDKATGYMSESLPTTAGSPDKNIGPVANGQEYANNLGRQGTQGIGPVADGQVYGNMLENAPNAGTKGIGPLADGDAYAQSLGKGGGMSPRLADALNDKDGINSYMSKFSGESQKIAKRRAFLDAKDSMSGLKAREALDGYAHAGGKYYAQEGDKAKSLKPGDHRKIARGETSAQELLKSYTQGLAQAGALTPAERQDPATAGKEFRTDTGITASDPVSQTSALDSKDFSLNNDDGKTGFGTSVDIGNKKGNMFPAKYAGM